MKSQKAINPRVHFLQILILFGGIAVFLLGVIIKIFPSGHSDPFYYRLFFLISCLTVFFVSKRLTWATNQLENIFAFLAGLYIVWMGYIAFINKLDIIIALTLIISLLGISLTFTNARKLIIFLVFFYAAFTPLLLLIEGPNLNPVIVLSFIYVTGFLGYLVVVSQERARNKILLRNADFQTLINSIEESIFLISKNYRILKLNNNGSEVVSRFIKRNINEGDFFLHYLTVDQVPKFRKSFSRALHGQTLVLERKLYSNEDELLWFEFKYIPVRNSQGEINAVLFSALDITTKKLSSEALRQSENKFRTIFQEAPVCMVILSLEKNILQVNESFIETFGYSEKEILNSNISEIIHPDNRGEFEEQTGLVLMKILEEFRGEIRYKKIDQTYVHTIIRVSRISSYNKPDFLLAQIVDIDQIKSSEETLKLKNEELKKANEELDKFVYSAAHDLRAPLASVLGLVNVMKAEPGENHNEYIDLIEKSIFKLDNFIRDVIDYSRNSRQGISIESIDLSILIRKAFENHIYLNGQSKIQIDIQVDPNTNFFGDKARMEIILNNLISNAIKYFDPTKKKPFIKVMAREEKHDIRLTIMDNGIGISPDNIDKIFNIFYRGHEQSKGSGLGLYIVKETVEKLNGIIQVESTPGIGTTFKIRIPNSVQEAKLNLLS